MSEIDNRPGMIYKWVKNIYYGEMAKHVLGLSSAGVGYIILDNNQEGSKLEVVAAFRVAETYQGDYSLTDLNEIESDKMEKILIKRQGVPQGA